MSWYLLGVFKWQAVLGLLGPGKLQLQGAVGVCSPPIRKTRLIVIRASIGKRTPEVARPTALLADCSLEVGPGGGLILFYKLPRAG